MDNKEIILLVAEIVGTFAFAVSGIRWAAIKKFDWFGAYIVGLATAIGGGTLRDLLLKETPFWMINGWYLTVTALSMVIVVVFRRLRLKAERPLFIFDTIGLGLFVVAGIEKSLLAGYPMWVAIIMGVFTGAFGGVLRDILINEVPLIFKADLYATACIIGGLVYWLVMSIGGSETLAPLSCALVIFIIRYCTLRFDWRLPLYELTQNDKENEQGSDN